MGAQPPGNQPDNHQHGGAFYPTVLGVIWLVFRNLYVQIRGLMLSRHDFDRINGKNRLLSF